ncbi:PaaI family thioesterase [Gordonia sp. X0973]|uniref:PaaI family thioesterase n=1 Tax=Gordonia sp. X0973 TaxID=2742602 RepID=UPI000F533707|nr:PaaI family thioesterase [Gordonia sp. X0973]QKT07420.1 PaaI family thioesterase [Gordonia sp. X0973]
MSVFDGHEAEVKTAAEVARDAEVLGPLTDSVRSLIDATVMTDADPAEIARALELVTAATELLNRERMPRPFGVKWNADGSRRSWGNAVVGLRNPIAPPLHVRHVDGVASAEATIGPAYEGPPGLVHGGIVALLLDQVLGSAADHAGVPGMTGTLTVRYRRGTRLGPLRVHARVDRVEGVKTFAVGQVETADGVCAEAEGIFVLPREVRELGEKLGRPQ